MRNNGEFGKNVLKFGLAATLLTTEFMGACSMPKKRFDEKGNPIAAVSPETVKPTPTPDGKSDAGWSISGLYNKAASMIGGGDKPKPTPTSEVVDVSKIETEHLELKKTDAVQFTPAERGQVSNTQESKVAPVATVGRTTSEAYQMSHEPTNATSGPINYKSQNAATVFNPNKAWDMQPYVTKENRGFAPDAQVEELGTIVEDFRVFKNDRWSNVSAGYFALRRRQDGTTFLSTSVIIPGTQIELRSYNGKSVSVPGVWKGNEVQFIVEIK